MGRATRNKQYDTPPQAKAKANPKSKAKGRKSPTAEGGVKKTRAQSKKKTSSQKTPSPKTRGAAKRAVAASAVFHADSDDEVEEVLQERPAADDEQAGQDEHSSQASRGEDDPSDLPPESQQSEQDEEQDDFDDVSEFDDDDDSDKNPEYDIKDDPGYVEEDSEDVSGDSSDTDDYDESDDDHTRLPTHLPGNRRVSLKGFTEAEIRRGLKEQQQKGRIRRERRREARELRNQNREARRNERARYLEGRGGQPFYPTALPDYPDVSLAGMPEEEIERFADDLAQQRRAERAKRRKTRGERRDTKEERRKRRQRKRRLREREKREQQEREQRELGEQQHQQDDQQSGMDEDDGELPTALRDAPLVSLAGMPEEVVREHQRQQRFSEDIAQRAWEVQQLTREFENSLGQEGQQEPEEQLDSQEQQEALQDQENWGGQKDQQYQEDGQGQQVAQRQQALQDEQTLQDQLYQQYLEDVQGQNYRQSQEGQQYQGDFSQQQVQQLPPPPQHFNQLQPYDQSELDNQNQPADAPIKHALNPSHPPFPRSTYLQPQHFPPALHALITTPSTHFPTSIINSHVLSTRIVLHPTLPRLFTDFISHKRVYGTQYERRIYDSGQQTWDRLVPQLLTKRAFAYDERDAFGDGEQNRLTLLRDERVVCGALSKAEWRRVGKAEESANEFVLSDEYLSHDEQFLSSLLVVSGPVLFAQALESGGLEGEEEWEDEEAEFEKEGIAIQVSAPRLEVSGEMDAALLLQGGDKPGLRGRGMHPELRALARRWLGQHDLALTSTAAATAASARGPAHPVIDADAYRARVRLMLETVLLEASARAVAANKPAWLRFTDPPTPLPPHHPVPGTRLGTRQLFYPRASPLLCRLWILALTAALNNIVSLPRLMTLDLVNFPEPAGLEDYDYDSVREGEINALRDAAARHNARVFFSVSLPGEKLPGWRNPGWRKCVDDGPPSDDDDDDDDDEQQEQQEQQQQPQSPPSLTIKAGILRKPKKASPQTRKQKQKQNPAHPHQQQQDSEEEAQDPQAPQPKHLLIVTYHNNGNALPGNTLWAPPINPPTPLPPSHAAAHALARTSTVAELHNPFLNSRLKSQVLVQQGPDLALPDMLAAPVSVPRPAPELLTHGWLAAMWATKGLFGVLPVARGGEGEGGAATQTQPFFRTLTEVPEDESVPPLTRYHIFREQFHVPTANANARRTLIALTLSPTASTHPSHNPIPNSNSNRLNDALASALALEAMHAHLRLEESLYPVSSSGYYHDKHTPTTTPQQAGAQTAAQAQQAAIAQQLRALSTPRATALHLTLAPNPIDAITVPDSMLVGVSTEKVARRPVPVFLHGGAGAGGGAMVPMVQETIALLVVFWAGPQAREGLWGRGLFQRCVLGDGEGGVGYGEAGGVGGYEGGGGGGGVGYEDEDGGGLFDYDFAE